MLVALNNDDKKYEYHMVEIVMSWIGLFGSILTAAFIGFIIKPVYKGMQGDVFIKIGGGDTVWEVYKWFTLCKGFIKLDLIANILFMITSLFFWSSTNQSWAPLIPEILVCILVVVNNVHAHILINNKLADHFKYFLIFRGIIQFFYVIKFITM